LVAEPDNMASFPDLATKNLTFSLVAESRECALKQLGKDSGIRWLKIDGARAGF